MQTNAIYNDTTIKPSNYVWFRNISVSEMPFIRNRANTVSFEMQLPTASDWSSAWGHRCRIRVLDTEGYEVQRLYPVASFKECVNWKTTTAGTWYSFTGNLTFDALSRGRYLEILWCVQKTRTSSDSSRRFSRCSFIFNKTSGKLELLETSDNSSASKLRTMISKKTVPLLTDSNYLYAYEPCMHKCSPSLIAKRNKTTPTNIDITFKYSFVSWYNTLNGISQYATSEGIRYSLLIDDVPATNYNSVALPVSGLTLGDGKSLTKTISLSGITVPVENIAKLRIKITDPFDGAVYSTIVVITSGAGDVNLHLAGDSRGGIGIGKPFARPTGTGESQLQIHYPAYFNNGGFNCINYVEGVNDTHTRWYNGAKVYCYVITNNAVTTTKTIPTVSIGTINDSNFNPDNIFAVKAVIKQGDTWQVNHWCNGVTNEYPRARVYVERSGSNNVYNVNANTGENGSYANYLTNAKINVMVYYHANN